MCLAARRRRKFRDGGGRSRIAYFDNLKGVLIILVVVGHVVYPVSTSPHMFSMRVIDFIYLFHMPLFLFASGLFARSVFKDGVMKASNVLYYALLSVILSFLLSLEKFLLGGAFSFNPFLLGGIPWYLMVLAFYLCAVPLFAALKPALALGISIVASVASGYYEIGDLLALSRAFVFLPFFLAGFYLGGVGVTSVLERMASSGRMPIVRLVAVFVLVATALVFFCFDAGGLSALRSLYSGRIPLAPIAEGLGFGNAAFAPILLRASYYIAVAIVSAAIMVLVPRRGLGCLTTVGRNSLQVYFFHALVYYAFNAFALAAFLYGAMPSWAATALLYLIGVAVAFALGVMPFLGAALEWVRRGVKRIVG